MKADPILEEVWRVKDKLSREMAANPVAYSAKLNAIADTEKMAGRKVIRSAAELKQYLATRELHEASTLALNDKPATGFDFQHRPASHPKRRFIFRNLAATRSSAPSAIADRSSG